ncbi:hypothetical protein DM860_013061 [Cuscuta australis]|uniref:Uncharacterized protein n=1 Tax=Cuscuta australis TaxID=267555 RepID=A0A328D451_9ASTE|nr:hypothetical protein DM860_013061 [Cuscuta australis]
MDATAVSSKFGASLLDLRVEFDVVEVIHIVNVVDNMGGPAGPDGLNGGLGGLDGPALICTGLLHNIDTCYGTLLLLRVCMGRPCVRAISGSEWVQADEVGEYDQAIHIPCIV